MCVCTCAHKIKDCLKKKLQPTISSYWLQYVKAWFKKKIKKILCSQFGIKQKSLGSHSLDSRSTQQIRSTSSGQDYVTCILAQISFMMTIFWISLAIIHTCVFLCCCFSFACRRRSPLLSEVGRSASNKFCQIAEGHLLKSPFFTQNNIFQL